MKRYKTNIKLFSLDLISLYVFQQQNTSCSYIKVTVFRKKQKIKTITNYSFSIFTDFMVIYKFSFFHKKPNYRQDFLIL
ncbi:hypothetical protein E18064_80022 [Elizabethkingia anophelis]|nr:hypothetical protein E18064_80022 [Elizabethkingia anophelis]